MLRETVPRMPIGFHSPAMLSPSLVAGTAMYSLSRMSSGFCSWVAVSSIASVQRIP